MNARWILASFATLALAPLATGTVWALTCQPVNGHSATQISFPQDGCMAPGGLCTSGSVVGGLQGSLEARALSTQGDLDARIPSVLRFIGESLITTKDGDTLLVTARRPEERPLALAGAGRTASAVPGTPGGPR